MRKEKEKQWVGFSNEEVRQRDFIQLGLDCYFYNENSLFANNDAMKNSHIFFNLFLIKSHLKPLNLFFNLQKKQSIKLLLFCLQLYISIHKFPSFFILIDQIKKNSLTQYYLLPFSLTYFIIIYNQSKAGNIRKKYTQQKQTIKMYSNKKQYKPVNDKAIIPLTIHQINTELKEDSLFDGQNFYTISIVGRLENYHRENNSNMFKFCDGTGKIQGRINLTGGKMPAFAEGINFETNLNNYYFVVFKPRFADGEKKFYIQMIKPVVNYNTVSKHFSDVILSTLVRRRN